ncbi:VP3 [Grifec polyomavirus GB3]|nr:VP3 [Grifec polyomavirus GB3]
MALQQWRPDYLAEFVPGYRTFEYYVSLLTGYTGQALTTASQLFWRGLQRETERELARISREAAAGYSQRAFQSLARILDTARYALIESPRNLYIALSDYYRDLSLSPPQLRDVSRRLRERYGENTEHTIADFLTEPTPLSGEYVVRYPAPGGTNHIPSQDWILLLILGLLGQQIEREREEEELEEAKEYFEEDEEDED